MLRRDPSDRFVKGVLTVSVVVFGVAMLSMYGSPISFDSPDQEVEIDDASEPLHLNESGEVAIVAISHAGGEPIAIDDLAVFIGSEEDGNEFSSATDWSMDAGDLTLELRLNGEPLGGENTSTYEPGDSITLQKTKGAIDGVDTLDLHIVVVDTESGEKIGERLVTAE